MYIPIYTVAIGGLAIFGLGMAFRDYMQRQWLKATDADEVASDKEFGRLLREAVLHAEMERVLAIQTEEVELERLWRLS